MTDKHLPFAGPRRDDPDWEVLCHPFYDPADWHDPLRDYDLATALKPAPRNRSILPESWWPRILMAVALVGVSVIAVLMILYGMRILWPTS